MRALILSRLARTSMGVLALLAAAPVSAASRPAPPPKIVNGLASFDRPTTAALLYGSRAELGCSGTLIGCQTVLTAAHCVEGERPRNIQVYLQHAGLFAVSRIAIHPRYNSDDADVAVLKLGSRVTGIVPTPFNSVADPASRAGSPGAIVGFGVTSGNAEDAGIKRAGRVTTTRCSSATGGDFDDTTYVCWRFDGSVGPAGQDSNTCYGDSGGPLFLELGGREVVAGVTSGGLEDDCGPGDVGYDANVFTWRSFIQGQLGNDSTAACSDLPVVGSPSTPVVGRGGSLSGGKEVRYTFQVGAGARELRIGLNGEDNGSLDADLYVQRGAAVSTTSFSCQRRGAGNFAACRFPAPAAGAWSVLVRGQKGSGAFQLVGTAFGATLTADGGTGGGGGTTGPSCRGNCGDTPDGLCWCDSDCEEFGDCCADYRDVCAFKSSCERRVCAGDPYCCSGQWDPACDAAATRICG